MLNAMMQVAAGERRGVERADLMQFVNKYMTDVDWAQKFDLDGFMY